MKRELPPIAIDLALVASLTVLGYVGALWLDLFDDLAAWFRVHEAREVEELLGALFVLPIALAFFACRRWQQTARALQEREAAEPGLAEAARLEGVLLAARTMQHEINNQLGITVGYAELLAEEPTLSSEQREWARTALQGAERAVGLLDRLRTLTHVDVLHIGAPDGPVLNLKRPAQDRRAAARG